MYRHRSPLYNLIVTHIMPSDLTHDELKTALAAADRGMRLPYIGLFVFGGLSAFAVGVALRYLNFDDPTHIVITCAVVFLYCTMNLLAGLLQARQNAANARMIHALQLLDERLSR